MNSKIILAKVSEHKKELIFSFFLAIAVLLWLGVIRFGDSTYVDEVVHRRQILRTLKGNYSILQTLTTLPGYHFTIAIFAKILKVSSPTAIRLISFALSLFSIWFFFLISKRIRTEERFLKTLQYVFLPITFFYFPFIYTDIFSLALILCTFYFTLNKRFTLSAVFALASMLVRQNNIIWILFFWIYVYIQKNNFSFDKTKIITHFKKTSGYLLIFFLFALFVWQNKGIAIGDRSSHQAGLYLGNIYFFLATAGVLFAPSTFFSLIKIKRENLKRFLLLGIIPGAVLALIFTFFHPALHEYNISQKYLRNIILHGTYGQYAWLYALAIFFGYQTLFLMKLKEKSWILLPFIIVSLLPSLLVEQRYYIVPLVLLLLLREKTNIKIEWLLVLNFFILSSALVYMVLKLNIFF